MTSTLTQSGGVWRHAAVVVLALEGAAVALWLVPASVQIVRWPAAGPVRAALFGPQYQLLWLAGIGGAAAAALLVWARSAGRANELARALAPLCLLWTWTLPYLPWIPDRVPLVLALAGPIRWLVALVALGLVAGATIRPSRGARAIEPHWWGRRSAFAFSLTLYLGFGALSARAMAPGGDQPHYLIIAHSLLTDGDIRIENNHANRDYQGYFPGPLAPHYLAPGLNGEIYSVHAPGLPALLLPAYGLAGYPGAVVFICLLSALAALAVFDLAERLGGRRTAWLTWAAVCLTVPFVPHSWLIFPEMPAALLVAWAALWLSGPAEQPIRTWILRGTALGLLPWLHTKFVVFLAMFVVALVLRLRRDPRALAGFLAPVSIAVGAWLLFFHAIYGVFDPQAPYGDFVRTEVLIRNIPRGLLGLFFDQKFGLLVYAPVYAMAGFGAWTMVRREDTRFLAVVLLATAAIFVASSTRLYMWWGGSSAPARFLVPVLPCLAPMLAMAIARLQGAFGRGLLAVWLSISLLVAAVGLVRPERLMLFSEPHGRARIAEWLQAGSPLAGTLATFTTEDWVTPIGTLAPWLAAGLVGALVMVLVARRWRAVSPLSVGMAGCVTFVLGAGLLTARPVAAVREETAARGVLSMMSAFDGDRHRPFDYAGLRKVTHEVFVRSIVLEGRRVPAGPVSLPPGSYEARVWWAGGLGRQGEVVVSSTPRAVFGRLAGALGNPAVVPFDLPVAVGRVTVSVADQRLAASAVRVEIAPKAIVPRHAREQARAIESIPGGPGRYIVYTDDRAYPEGGVFWTRGTEASTIAVAPAGARRLRLVLHLGPLGGEVRISVAGMEETTHVAAGSVSVFETDLPQGRQLVPVTIQSPTTFRPFEVDPSSNDRRRLGCQVRVELS
jgi:hypothetical protein